MAAVTSKNLATCKFYATKAQTSFGLSPHQPASIAAISSRILHLHKSKPAVVSITMGQARAFTCDTRKSLRAQTAGRRELWAIPAEEFSGRRAIEELSGVKGRCGFRQRGSMNGPRAFAKKEGNISEEAKKEALPRVWRADNEWLAKHGIPTIEIDESGGLPRLHLNSKLDLPLVKLPPSLEWLDLYGESQVNLRKRLAVSLDPFGEPQVKLRERLAESLDPFGEPQVKLREKLKVSLDPFGEPQVKLREKIAVNLDPFGEPQVKLREQLAATLKPPLSKPPGGHKPLIFHPPGTVETPKEQEQVKKGPKRNPFLEGNFAPVEEECPEEIPCHVIGNLPGDLRGQFLRNGPNPRFPQDAGAYHWFDGDGMVHSLKFQGLDRPPVYSSKYIRTSGFKEESQLGRGKFWPGVKMEPLGRCLVTAAVRSMRRREEERDVPGLLAVKNTANTGLIRHAGKLFAMWEGGHPYVVDEALDTKGPTTFDGRLVSSFSAHPKLDPQTGELIYFGYSLVARPYLSYGVISKEGEIVHQADIDLPNPVMMHDFAITEHYSLFLDFPFVFNPRRMMEVANGKRQKPFVFDGTVGGRIGVLPRFGTARNLRWFSVGPGMVLHVLNAFEEPAETDDTFLNGALSFAQASVSKSDGHNPTADSSDGGKLVSSDTFLNGALAQASVSKSDGRGLTASSSDGGKPVFNASRAGDQGLSSSRSDGKKPGFSRSEGRGISGSASDGEESSRDAGGRIRRPVIVLRAMHYDTFTGLGLADVSGGGATCPEDAYLHEYRLDLETGGVEERRISDISADFPVINASRQGLYNRYGYMSRFVATSSSVCQDFGCTLTPLFDALVKIDFETGSVQTHEFGPGRLGGEAAFVSRAAPVRPPGFEEILDQLPSYLLDFLPPGAFPRAQGDWASGLMEQPGEVPGDEDEGWLVVHVWDEALRQSEVLVIDAKDFEGPVLARVVLPRRVPYGFHGTFLPEEEAGV